MGPGEKVVRTWFQKVWNEGRLEENFANLAQPNIVFHSVGMDGGRLQGLDGFRAHHAALNSAFSDIHFVVDDVIESGDRVALRWSLTMRHSKPGLGIAPTSKAVRLSGMAMVRLKDGKVVESWDEWNRMGFLKQLGLPIP